MMTARRDHRGRSQWTTLLGVILSGGLSIRAAAAGQPIEPSIDTPGYVVGG